MERAIQDTRAAEIGREHGTAAAEFWARFVVAPPYYAQSGAARRAVLRDYPRPDLSGEWAGTLTGPALCELVGETDPDCFSDVCDAYERAYTAAVEEVARAHGIEIGGQEE